MGSLLILGFIMMSVTVAGQSFFGHPWSGAAGFGDMLGSGFDEYPAYNNRYNNRYNHRYGRYPARHRSYYDDYHDEYYERFHDPCPRYEPMQISDWNVGRNQHLVLQVSLPDVHYRDTETWLSKDGSLIHTEGYRSLPLQGRGCLPAGAKVSRDGRYEILSAAIPVPGKGDVQKASVRQMRDGNGLIISMPQRTQRQPAPVQSERKAFGTENDNVNSRQRDMSNGASQKSYTTSATAPLEDHTAALQESVHTQKRSHVVLPPSTGIQVEDIDFPWPEKSPDACSGWVDNRGEFQSY